MIETRPYARAILRACKRTTHPRLCQMIDRKSKIIRGVSTILDLVKNKAYP